MKDISENFRDKDGSRSPKAKRGRPKKVFDGFNVDPLFHTIYNNAENKEQADLIEEAVIDATVNLMSSNPSPELKELERYNLFSAEIAKHGLEVDTDTLKLREKKSLFVQIPLDLSTSYDYDFNKSERRVRKRVNFITDNLIIETKETASEYLNGDELVPFSIRENIQSDIKEDKTVLLNNRVAFFLQSMVEGTENNNRKSFVLERILKGLIEDISALAKPVYAEDSLDVKHFTDNDLTLTIERLKDEGMKALQEAYDALYEYAFKGEKSAPPIIRGEKCVFKEENEPSEVAVLRGNEFSIYRDFEDELFYCKVLGIKGI